MLRNQVSYSHLLVPILPRQMVKNPGPAVDLQILQDKLNPYIPSFLPFALFSFWWGEVLLATASNGGDQVNHWMLHKLQQLFLWHNCYEYSVVHSPAPNDNDVPEMKQEPLI